MANKLELTWFGKDEPMHIEPRPLIENTELSNTGADPDTENMRSVLIGFDNPVMDTPHGAGVHNGLD